MNIFANIGLGMIGFLIGNLLFARVGRWIHTIYEMVQSGGPRAGVIAMLLLHDGPWLLIVASFFAYYISPRAWSTPMYVGAAVAIVFFGAITVVFARTAAKGRANAA